MIKVYMVFINGGFGGIKYFQEKENAENYIRENGGTLEIESATSQEYCRLDFSDPIKADYHRNKWKQKIFIWFWGIQSEKAWWTCKRIMLCNYA